MYEKMKYNEDDYCCFLSAIAVLQGNAEMAARPSG
jgi:hypothetical protein